MANPKQKVTYYYAKSILESCKCQKCFGTGTNDDAEPGDISYREVPCNSCNGTGLVKNPLKKEYNP